MATITLDYLLPELRLRIGDYTPPYRYLDEWLLRALTLAAKHSYRYIRAKYLVSGLDVYRNPDYTMFEFPEATSGVVEAQDEYIFILLAAIIVLDGALQNNAWDIGSWQDAEIRYSNIESGKARDKAIDRLWSELDRYLLRPTKRLATVRKSSLPGFLNNTHEREGDY